MPHRVFFAADTHLKSGDERRAAHFAQFLEKSRLEAGELYLLGDTFDFWIEYPHVILTDYFRPLASMRCQIEKGLRLKLIAGNRDFPMAGFFREELGAEVLGDVCVIRLGGKRIYLTHGDLLCTNDLCYRIWRVFIHSCFSRLFFRLCPVWMARLIVRCFMRASRAENAEKPERVLSIAPEAVKRVLAGGADVLVAGHTHINHDETIEHTGGSGRLITVASWQDGPPYPYLAWEDGEFRFEEFRPAEDGPG